MALNLAVLVFAFGAGWRSSTIFDERLAPPRTERVEYDLQVAVDDARTILRRNSDALFWIVLLGMFSAGGYGLLQLGANGYAIGYALSAASRAAPASVWHVLSYAPLEFAAFVMGNCAAQMALYCGYNWLKQKPISELHSVFLVVGCSLLVLSVAAGIEAHAIQRVGSIVK